MRKLLIGVAALAIGAIAPVSAFASPVPPGWIPLGGVNLTAYCAQTYGHNYKSALLGNTAGDWRCVPVVHHAGTTQKQISVEDACRMEYGRSNLIADAVWSQPLSWTCYGPGRRLR